MSTNGQPQRLGILGGTFDPVHIGHLILANQARELFELNRVLFIPAGSPAYKLASVYASAEDRYRMLQLATEDDPFLSVSRMEIEREGVTYTIDTVRQLIEELPAGSELFFITGADVAADMHTWKNADQLANLVTVLAANRGDDDVVENPALYKIHRFTIPSIDISSSEIRKSLAQGRSVRYLIPVCVERYCRENNLYV
jgi:nicotinate-nucleotide adenylyltransferase